jgi:hypothetical protein
MMAIQAKTCGINYYYYYYYYYYVFIFSGSAAKRGP